MCNMTTRLMINHKIPLRLELPESFVYFALFDTSPVLMSSALEQLTVAKHETIPMCKKMLKDCEMTPSTLRTKVEAKVIAEQISQEGIK